MFVASLPLDHMFMMAASSSLSSLLDAWEKTIEDLRSGNLRLVGVRKFKDFTERSSYYLPRVIRIDGRVEMKGRFWYPFEKRWVEHTLRDARLAAGQVHESWP